MVAAAFGLAAFNGIETSEGTLDLIGGCLLILAWLWPGANFWFASQSGQIIELEPQRIGWPSPSDVAQHSKLYGRDYGAPRDGLVFRSWRFPFPHWATARDYSETLFGP